MPLTYALCWSEDGKRLNVVSSKAFLGSMDVASKKVLAQPVHLKAFDPMIRNEVRGTAGWGFTWSPNGKTLATVSGGVSGSSVSFWDVATESEGPPILKAGANRPMLPMMGGGCPPAWDSSGSRLAVGWEDGTIQTVRPGANREAVRSTHGAQAWSRDSKCLWGGPDTMAAAAEAAKDAMGQAQQMFKDMEKGMQGGGLVPPDPKLQFGGGGRIDQRPKHQIQRCDAVTGAILKTFGDGKAKGASLPGALAESPDGKWLAAVTGAGSPHLWATKGDDPPVSLDNAPGARQGSGGRMLLAWKPKSNLLAATSMGDNAIRLWDSETRKAVQTFKGHDKPVRSLVWSADGRRLASADDGGTIRVWDEATDKEIPPFTYIIKSDRALGGHPRPATPSTLAISPDGTRLAVASEDELVHVWDVDTGKELTTLHGDSATLDFHDVFGAVAWSPDGKRLVSINPDRTFSLWDTATWKKILVLQLRGRSGRRAELGFSAGGTLAWSPDGQQLAFFGGDTIWDATPETEPGR